MGPHLLASGMRGVPDLMARAIQAGALRCSPPPGACTSARHASGLALRCSTQWVRMGARGAYPLWQAYPYAL